MINTSKGLRADALTLAFLMFIQTVSPTLIFGHFSLSGSNQPAPRIDLSTRFQKMEELATENGQTISDLSFAELDDYWNQAKKLVTEK